MKGIMGKHRRGERLRGQPWERQGPDRSSPSFCACAGPAYGGFHKGQRALSHRNSAARDGPPATSTHSPQIEFAFKGYEKVSGRGVGDV